ncbi:MAG: hypothetical protein AMJ69_04910 [Gammaproteobacteria bacterium SG8_47]|nr:MAG: hypothetical protein AMJ69_04910 [Gammaproteobacteria bacterium SG8_47]
MFTLGVGGMAAAYAGPAAVEFSAEARQSAPQRPAQVAQMYVSKDAVRTEFTANGQRIAEIVFPDQRKRFVLFLQRGEYMEQMAPDALAVQAPQDTDSPCAGVPNVTCSKLGQEQVNGRLADKWEFVADQGGRQARSLHWIDVERRLPLRDMLPDGTVSELRQVATESLGGRSTEKWELTVTRPDGQSQRRLQWYDAELKIAVREEMSGGFVRELANIEVGPQPAELFELPEGFRKVSAPSAAPTGQAPAGAPPAGYR